MPTVLNSKYKGLKCSGNAEITVNPVKMQHLVYVHKHALLPYNTPITPQWP